MALKRVDSLIHHKPIEKQPKLKQIKQLSSGIDLATIEYNNLLNASYGLVIGAGIGDSLGSYLEFSSGNSLEEVIDAAMTMPGGGTWGSSVTPGQATDDTELAISLCRGIYHMINHQNDIMNNNKSCNTPQNEQKFDSIDIDENNSYIKHIYDSSLCSRTI